MHAIHEFVNPESDRLPATRTEFPATYFFSRALP
jgi:hypothetical protein